MDGIDFFLPEGPDKFKRRPIHHGTGLDDFVLGNHGPCPDDAFFSDIGIGQKNGAHADQCTTADMFAMDNGIVSYHAVIVQHERVAGINMNDGIILDIDPLADYDFIIITTDDDAGPQIGPFFYGNLANDGYIVCQIGTGINIRPLAAKGINICHTNSSCTISLCCAFIIYHSTGRHKTDMSPISDCCGRTPGLPAKYAMPGNRAP